jgi:sugar/nucleoside kinase (ribokinase family)
MQRIQRGISSSNILFGSGTDELMPATGAENPQVAAQLLVASDRAVVCRAGSAGADVYLPDGSISHCDAFQVPVVDTLGAGDAYNAGFITAAVEGLSLAEANRRGNAVAAWKIMHNGARNFPNRDQLEAFIQTVTVQDRE